jgi:tight adherence protein B
LNLAVVLIISFIAVFLVIAAVALGAASIKDSPKAELKRRLRRMARNERDGGLSDDLRAEIIKETPPFERFLSRVILLRNLDKKLDHAGLKISVAKFLLIIVAAVLIGFIGGLYLALLWEMSAIWIVLLVILFTVAITSLPFLYLAILTSKRVEKFTELFPDALTMIARSLRAGHSFTSAIELVGTEVSEPVGSLFKTAYDQQLLGLRINEALNNMNERIESLDLRFFTTAVAINSEVGGNLAEILDKLAMTIRERLKIRRQVKVYTAQARMSGYILAALPIITFFLINILHPGYENTLLKEDQGKIMLIVAAVLQVVGFFVIRKIINIKI